MSNEKPEASFVTFYSFKGGVGRSMALINTAGILAGRGFRVLVIDVDLEAPGLSYLNPDAPDAATPGKAPKHPIQLGFVDLLSDAKERGMDADLFALPVSDLAGRYTQTYKLPEELREFKDGSLHIMPAGKLDGSYAQRLDALNLRELYQQGLGEPLIRAFKKKIAEADLFDYVLVDSRTGFSDEAGICTRDLPDHIMILSGLNRQNVEGTSEFLKALRIATNGKAKFQIILSPVPNGEDALLDEREAAAKASFEEAWGSEVDLSLQIPYHPQLALTEEPHIFRRRRGYLFEAYGNIERSMRTSLGHNESTLTKKIEETIEKKDYVTGLRDLRHLVRLNAGRGFLSTLVTTLVLKTLGSLRGKAEGEPDQDRFTLDNLLSDKEGRPVVEFMVDQLPLDKPMVFRRELLDKLTEKSPDLAERLHKRMVDAAPKDADILGAYALFLDHKLGNRDGAETYYKRAIAAEPKSGLYLSKYAAFLQKRGDKDGAEMHYKRAIDADPNNVLHLFNYALFLDRQRGDKVGAEASYRRALEIDQKHVTTLTNYGQVLADLGRLADSKNALLSALKYLDQSSPGTAAEVCFSLWLVSRMQVEDAQCWERAFKFLIQHGFVRSPWDFDRMLEMAEKTLQPEESEYAKSLASAFLDESKVPQLEHYDRWRALEPLDPMTAAKNPTP
jgi:tetratricopeptide (TPR) repeat protein